MEGGMDDIRTDEMLEGYRDGLDLDSPTPSGNRSAAYHHGFLNGRDDRHSKPRDTADVLRRRAGMILGKHGEIK